MRIDALSKKEIRGAWDSRRQSGDRRGSGSNGTMAPAARRSQRQAGDAWSVCNFFYTESDLTILVQNN